jgi:hypothetical protein
MAGENPAGLVKLASWLSLRLPQTHKTHILLTGTSKGSAQWATPVRYPRLYSAKKGSRLP